MSIIIIIFLSIISTVIYRKFHTIFHPGFITSTIWLVLVCSYNVFNHGLYDVSNRLYISIYLWVSTFCLSSYIFSIAKLPTLNYCYNNKITWIWTTNKMFLCYIGLLLLLIIVQYNIGTEINTGNAIAGMRDALTDETTTMPLSQRILSRFEVIIHVIFFGVILTENKKKIKKWLILGILLFIYTCLLGTKGKILELFITLVYILSHKKKIKWSHIIIIACLVLLLLASMSLVRDDVEEIAFLELIVIYTLSPLTAFDQVLNFGNFIPTYNGVYTFKRIYDVLLPGTLASNYGNAVTGWIMVPLPTNVYTIMYNYYLDFGMWGIGFMGCLMGTMWGIIYNYVRKHILSFVLMYSLMCYTLIFQFFGDWFFNMLSLSIQVIMYSIIIFLRFRLWRKKC